MQALELVREYYDNEAKANNGSYDGEEKDAYNVANSKYLKYLKIEERVFEEIERRVNELC